MNNFWQQATVGEFDYSSESLPQNALIALDNMGVISFIGEENKKFLQGQLTNNLELLSSISPLLAAHCDFKGKMWGLFQLFENQDTIHLLAPKSSLEQSLAEFKKYGVFSKTTIEDCSEQHVIMAAVGEQAKQLLAEQFGEIPAVGHSKPIEAGFIYQQQELEFLLILSEEQATTLLQASELPLVSREFGSLLDIRAGRPQVTEATVSQYVPQMMNVQALDGICFTKGCYMGQEVVARTRYLGRNKRALFVLSGQVTGNVAAGDELEVQLGENWRRAGTIVSAVIFNDNSTELTAVLANDSEQSQQFRVKEQQASSLSIQPLPYTIEEQS